jgi:hypothetical protein
MPDVDKDVHGAAYIDLVRRFGGTFRTYKTQVDGLGVAVPVDLLPGDAERVFILFINNGVGGVSVTPTPPRVGVANISIGVGADRAFNINDHATLPTDQWWLLAAVGDSVTVVACRRESIIRK